MVKNSDNNQKNFDFSFFISWDKKQIRWGYMQADIGKSTDSANGIVLLLSGRTEFMEKYQKAAAKLSCMGYHVMSLDWRGQGLSVRELPNRDKGYIKDFQFYINDLEFFYNLYVLPLSMELKLPITIITHSMGGHIVLRFLSKAYNDFYLRNIYLNNIKKNYDAVKNIQKAILISPMIDIITSPIKGEISNIITNFATRIFAYTALKLGLGAEYIPGGKDYSIKNAKFKNNLLTHDWDNFWLEHKEIAKNRNLALGGVTWGWLKAAFDSIDILKNRERVSKIDTPIWILSAKEDRVVSNKAQKKICRMLKNGKFISIPKARHEILFETDDIREVLWNKINNINNC